MNRRKKKIVPTGAARDGLKDGKRAKKEKGYIVDRNAWSAPSAKRGGRQVVEGGWGWKKGRHLMEVY